jgi:shikimate kinase
MPSRGKAHAYGAATIINAIATYRGSAFSIDLKTHAEVEVAPDLRGINGEAESCSEKVSAKLVERCVQIVFKKFKIHEGAHIKTTSEIPVARGLKSSSAAANAAVLATLSATGKKLEPLEAARLGVRAALDTGVTITGAFDDACASMLGGLVLTDNKKMKLVRRVPFAGDVLILVPEKRSPTVRKKVLPKMLAPLVDIAYDMALDGKYENAMNLNGFLYCVALGFDSKPIILALENGARAASLSGTGPAFAAIVDRKSENAVRDAWGEFGTVIKTKTNNRSAGGYQRQPNDTDSEKRRV